MKGREERTIADEVAIRAELSCLIKAKYIAVVRVYETTQEINSLNKSQN